MENFYILFMLIFSTTYTMPRYLYFQSKFIEQIFSFFMFCQVKNIFTFYFYSFNIIAS